MSTTHFTLISLFFYSIQNIARVYFLLSLLPLKKPTNQQKISFYVIYILLSSAINYFLNFNSLLRFVSDMIFSLVLLLYFCKGKFYTKILYYVLSMNVMLFVDCLLSGTAVIVFKVDFITLTSSSIIIPFLTIGTLLINVFHLLLLKILKRRQGEMKAKYTIGIILLTIIQSLLVIAQICNIAFNILQNIYPLLAICIILSYFLVKYVSSYIYEEYKYKENTIYFIKQYEEQLKDYIRLKDNENEAQYLRHEIMNQLKVSQLKKNKKR